MRVVEGARRRHCKMRGSAKLFLLVPAFGMAVNIARCSLRKELDAEIARPTNLLESMAVFSRASFVCFPHKILTVPLNIFKTGLDREVSK